MKRISINEVFTPRSATVTTMYIDRPAHQRDLKRAIEGSLHAMLCGESGSGKTWLYTHVGEVENWKMFYANAGNAARHNSLTETIALAIEEEGEKELVEYTETLGGEVGAFGIGGSAGAERKYEVKARERLLLAFKSGREKSKGKKAVVVVDNLEAIFNKPALMEELGNIILLLDDPDYSVYRIKFLIVGVPSEIVEYYQRIPNLETVSNRIQEVGTVTGLSWAQIEDFIRRGFVEQLKVSLTVPQVKQVSEHIENVTLGIAQRLHEYCELLAYNIEDSEWTYEASLLEIADRKFLSGCLKKAYAVIDGFMNERKTKTGRRNQVLFALGKTKLVEFDVNQVEALVRREFPLSTADTALAVGQTMTELASGEAPLLRRAPKGATYRFADPRYLMCLRIMLHKSQEDERVMKATLRR